MLCRKSGPRTKHLDETGETGVGWQDEQDFNNEEEQEVDSAVSTPFLQNKVATSTAVEAAVASKMASAAAHVNMKGQVDCMARQMIDALSGANFTGKVQSPYAEQTSEAYEKAVKNLMADINVLVANRLLEQDGDFANLKANADAVLKKRTTASSQLFTSVNSGNPAALSF